MSDAADDALIAENVYRPLAQLHGDEPPPNVDDAPLAAAADALMAPRVPLSGGYLRYDATAVARRALDHAVGGADRDIGDGDRTCCARDSFRRCRR